MIKKKWLTNQQSTEIYKHLPVYIWTNQKPDCIISWSAILWLVEVVVNGQKFVAL